MNLQEIAALVFTENAPTDPVKICRLFSRVEISATTGCWVWQGHKQFGYGQVTFVRKVWRTHRLVYTMLIGNISEGLTLDHLCRNRACCNPSHLEAVTQGENTRRTIPYRPATHKKANTCKHGHLMTPENTIMRPNGVHRRCRVCQTARTKNRHQRDPYSHQRFLARLEAQDTGSAARYQREAGKRHRERKKAGLAAPRRPPTL